MSDQPEIQTIPTPPTPPVPTLSSMQESLNVQLLQSLLQINDIDTQMEALTEAREKEQVKVKMFKDTLQGLQLAAKAEGEPKEGNPE